MQIKRGEIVKKSKTRAREGTSEILEGLGKIKRPKSSDVLADRLRGLILSDVYPVGSSLPPERELVDTVGLSRGSVREALRILESQGLVTIRAGRYGGSTVSKPTDDMLANHISLYAKGRSVPLRALVEVRQALEPMVAFLAAENRTEDDLEVLHTITERLDASVEDNVEVFLRENANWHDALATASHNELLRAFSRSVAEMLFEVSRLERFASKEIRKRVSLTHHKILEAIVARDAQTARIRAEKDIKAYTSDLEQALAVAAQGSVDSLND